MTGSANFVHPVDVCWTPTDPGIKRRVLTWNDDLMLVEVAFDKGAVGALHQHPHIQASYVAAGRVEVTIAGVTETLDTGASFIVPSNAVHGCVALEAGRLIDSFTPMRGEFVG